MNNGPTNSNRITTNTNYINILVRYQLRFSMASSLRTCSVIISFYKKEIIIKHFISIPLGNIFELFFTLKPFIFLLKTIKNTFKIAIILCIISPALISCESDENEIKNATSRKTGVEEGKNVKIIYTLGGKAKAKLTSPLMHRVKDTTNYVEFPQKVHVDFFTDTGKVESTLDAVYAKYFETESKIFLKDSVRFIGLQNGDTLYCSELYWDIRRPVYQFYTDKKVQIRTKTHIINGVGFETNQDFTDKVIKNITNSYIKVPAAEFPVN